jgi:hypothetical protein
MTIWRMCVASCIPKAAETHAEYVTLIAFPLQQWLHVRASMLRHTYIACSVILRIKQVAEEAATPLQMAKLCRWRLWLNDCKMAWKRDIWCHYSCYLLRKQRQALKNSVMKFGGNLPITNIDLANKYIIFFSKVFENHKFWTFVNWKLNKIFLEVENVH